MADLVINPDNVVLDATGSGVRRNGTAGVALSAGDVVYLDGSGESITLLLAQATTVDLAKAGGLVLNSAALGQPVFFAQFGEVAVGSAVAGEYYVLSHTLGKIKPVADLVAGEFATGIGWGLPGGKIDVKFNVSDTAVV